MKKISTPVAMVIAMLLLNITSKAQLSQDFEPIGTSSPVSFLPSRCWQFSNVSWSNSTILNNNGSLFILPATNLSVNGTIRTPFQNFPSNITVQFQYRLDKKLSTNATREIAFGLVDAAGNFNQLHVITLTSSANTQAQSYSGSFTITPGIFRFGVRLGGTQDGNTYLYFDNLNISGVSQYYTSGCNSAPVANNDHYSATMLQNVSGNLITNPGGTDSDPNGEGLTASIVTQPVGGTVSLSANGNFTFTPAAGFPGGLVTFTYRVTDNGYEPMQSNIATVTIYFPDNLLLPVKLMSFNGNLSSQVARFDWQVEQNETGLRFEIEKSADGQKFITAAIINTSGRNGKENYNTAVAQQEAVAYYRLKILNKDNSISYSNVIRLADSQNHSLELAPIAGTGSGLAFMLRSGGGQYRVAVYTTSGTMVQVQDVQVQKGATVITLDKKVTLASGQYIIAVQGNNERATTQLFIK